ncbi:uncharacterized protein [Nicotiana sylvestris]|uniref:uncharacterized protein n=1 Tax=Nicotiana sylvestris TaxID=4096 RepID=UPI00388CBB3B
MHDFIMAEDLELWDIICDGPFVPMKTGGKGTVIVPKTRKEYNDADRNAIEKNFRANKIIFCGIRPDEYNHISACQSAKEIWKTFLTAHEGTTQVKQSKIDMLTTEYELFEMKEDAHPKKQDGPKNTQCLPSSWESKVNAITEAKDLQKLTIDELIGNLKTYKMKRKKDFKRREPKKEKNLVLKAANRDSSSDEFYMEYLTRRFQKMIQKNGGIPKKRSSSRNFEENDCCHKYGQFGHFFKDLPLHKQDHYKANTEKATKRNQVPDRKFKRRDVANNMLKRALVDWGNSSSESEGETHDSC